ncbi:chitobiase [Marinomonas agarivorans]|nr:chitobiase [Marinomonas agarivorans]
MQLLVNHIGYLYNYPVRVMIQSIEPFDQGEAYVLDATNTRVRNCRYDAGKAIEEWHTGYCAELNLDGLTTGDYTIHVAGHEQAFTVLEHEDYTYLTQIYTSYFTKQRSHGPTDEKDKRSTPIDNPDKVVDLSGGWYDASGDTSKYLSHLSIANFMNPQQIPLVVYVLLSQIELHEGQQKQLLLDEALFGLDFLCRAQDDDGYFYTNVFDNWNKQLETREICAFTTQEGYRNDKYQAAFREGAGMSIAALAKGAKYDKRCLAIAEKGYQHLLTHNATYCEDGLENIIDYYTALMASVELYKAGSTIIQQIDIQHWVDKLIGCQAEDQTVKGYFRSRANLDRPFTHASDEGLPVIALLNAYGVLDNQTLKEQILNTCNRWLSYLLHISQSTYNPYHYPRHYAKPVGHPKTLSFFLPHANETGYWWQGENARLGSLSSAIYQYLSLVPECDQRDKLLELAVAMRNWLFGMNPFDISMVYGEGRNWQQLDDGHAFPNTPGGICNGITASLFSPFDIAMMETDHYRQFWRWSEQWLPHTSWWLMAIGYQQRFEQKELK